MIPKPPRQRVDVIRIMAYSLIPFVAIYAGWRIEKFWALLGIQLLVGIALGVTLGLVMEEQYAGTVSIIAGIAISVFTVRYFATKYNEGIRSP